MFGSSPSSELWQLCWQTCKPHTHGRAERRITLALFFFPPPLRKRLPTRSSQRRRRQANCPSQNEWESRSCLMGSARWVMGHKFKQSAKLTESPALLSSSADTHDVELHRLRKSHSYSLVYAGSHLCECLKQLFLWLWWETFSQKPSWLLPSGQETLDDWCRLLDVKLGSVISVHFNRPIRANLSNARFH